MKKLLLALSLLLLSSAFSPTTWAEPWPVNTPINPSEPQISSDSSPGYNFSRLLWAPKPKEIAILLPLSGPRATIGEDYQKGFRMGFTARSTGMPADCKVVFYDSHGDTEELEILIKLLHSEGRTLLLAGAPENPTAFIASRLCEELGLPLLLVGPDRDDLINPQSHFCFRLTPNRSQRLQLVQDYCQSCNPEIFKAGIIYSRRPDYLLQARRLRNFCAGLKLDLCIWSDCRRDGRDHPELLKQIENQEPEILFFLCPTADIAPLWRRARQLPTPPLALALNAFPLSETLADGDENLKYLIDLETVNSEINPDSATETPTLRSPLAAQGYAAAQTIAWALLAQSPDLNTGSLITTLESCTELQTICGPVSFSPADQPGHQNRMPLRLISSDHWGRQHQLYPPLPPEEMAAADSGPENKNGPDVNPPEPNR